MNRNLASPVIVLGGGPVGMVAALQASRHVRTTLIVRRLPSPAEPPRVEAVPASFLALLVEFGIHPRQIGVDTLHDSRSIAWERETAVETHAAVEAHIERPALDLALMTLVVASKRVRLVVADRGAEPAPLLAARIPGLRLIDASGRTAVSARKRIQPRKPWAARTFWTGVDGCHADTSLRIAALPGGFVYRLGASRHLVLGIVGRKETIVGTPHAVGRRLHDARTEWVLDRLPPIAALIPGRVSPASVQWTVGASAIAVGDAALARDTLSSQGLAAGVSDALHAVAGKSAEDDALRVARQIEQRLVHLQTLEQIITRCRFAEKVAWMEYVSFVREHLSHA